MNTRRGQFVRTIWGVGCKARACFESDSTSTVLVMLSDGITKEMNQETELKRYATKNLINLVCNDILIEKNLLKKPINFLQ